MKSKKLISLCLSAMLILSLTACSSQSAKETGDKNTSQVTEKVEGKSEGDSISAEKNLFDVEITIPSAILGEGTHEEIEAKAKESGVHEVKFNEDGSATYVMSKSDHKKLLSDTKKAIDAGIQEMLKDKDTYSFENIEYNDDCTEFTIYCDKAGYSEMQGLTAMVFYVYGNYYQALNAVNTDSIKTVVNFKDKDSKEVLGTFDSSTLNQ